jgi:hypothetical protein
MEAISIADVYRTSPREFRKLSREVETLQITTKQLDDAVANPNSLVVEVL